jgi:hypothetical protein
MSLRRPTVAFLLFNFYISPLCDVAQTSDCGIQIIYFHYKPFSRCRTQTSDCGTYCYLLFNISPLCGVAPTPDCGMLIFTLRGVASDTRSVFFYFIGFREDYRPTSFLFNIAVQS